MRERVDHSKEVDAGCGLADRFDDLARRVRREAGDSGGGPDLVAWVVRRAVAGAVQGEAPLGDEALCALIAEWRRSGVTPSPLTENDCRLARSIVAEAAWDHAVRMASGVASVPEGRQADVEAHPGSVALSKAPQESVPPTPAPATFIGLGKNQMPWSVEATSDQLEVYDFPISTFAAAPVLAHSQERQQVATGAASGSDGNIWSTEDDAVAATSIDPAPRPWPDLHSAEVWPGLPAMTAACLDRIVEDTVRELRAGLRRKVVGLGERFYARAIWLHVLRDNKVLESVCSYNTRMRDSFIPLETQRSIIAHVARENVGYVTGRAQDDPIYREGLEETQSEMAAPLPGWSKVSGVVNCESPEEGAFTEGDLKDLAAAVGVVVPDLMVLDSLDRPPHLGKWSPWHPEVWGPDLVPILTRLCEAVKRDCDGDGRMDDVECAVWWVDADNRRLAVYATSGYGQEYARYGMSIPFESALGLAVGRGLGDSILVGPDCKEWQRTYKAESMGVRRILVIPLHRKPDRSAGGPASALLTIYAFSASAEGRLPRGPAVRAMARMFSAVIAGYDRMRPRVVVALARHAMDNRAVVEDLVDGPFEEAEMARRRRDEPADRPAPSWLEAAIATLDAEARRDQQFAGFSVFILDPLTGRYRAATDTVVTGDGSPEYDVRADRGSYTVFHAENPGRVVIRNTPSDPGAEGFPSGPMNKHPERLSGPVLRHSRYMGFGLPDPGEPTRSVAVFKCVRSARQRPFTDGDARVLKKFAAAASGLVADWRKWRRDQDDAAPVAEGAAGTDPLAIPGRWNAPPPVASRPFADEAIDELWTLAARHEPVRAGVILRRSYDPTGGALSRYQVYSWRERGLTVPPSEEDGRLKLEGGDVALPRVRWDDIFGIPADGRWAVSFRSEAGGGVRSGIRVPFFGWSATNFIEGVLAIDFARDCPWTREQVTSLAIQAARLGRAFGRSRRDAPRGRLPDVASLFAEFRERVAQQWSELVLVGEGLDPRRATLATRGRPSEAPSWQAIPRPPEHEPPLDRSARRLGVRSCVVDGKVALEVPLIHGTSRPATYRVGTGLSRKQFGPQRRNETIGNIYRTWYEFCDDVFVPNGVSTFRPPAPPADPEVTIWESAVDWSQTHALADTAAN